MAHNPQKAWSKAITSRSIEYPAEYVIRIFKGKYPRLDFKSHVFAGKKILDVGCGDGANLAFLARCGFDAFGVEITDEIAAKVKENLERLGLQADVRVGSNASLPFSKGFFDYLLSWNACYYMDGKLNFDEHVAEFARVLKKNGYLVLSIPKTSNITLKHGEKLPGGYQIIRNDTSKLRNGATMKIFRSPAEIKKSFGKHFKKFIFGDMHDDCFGWNYHWYLVICQKK